MFIEDDFVATIQCMMGVLNTPIFSQELIIFPINHHQNWSLAIVNPGLWTLDFYDNSPSMRNKYGKDIAERIAGLLN